MASLGTQAHRPIGRSPFLCPTHRSSIHSPLIHLNQEDNLSPVTCHQHQGVDSMPSLQDHTSLLQQLKQETYSTPLRRTHSAKEQPWYKPRCSQRSSPCFPLQSTLYIPPHPALGSSPLSTPRYPPQSTLGYPPQSTPGYRSQSTRVPPPVSSPLPRELSRAPLSGRPRIKSMLSQSSRGQMASCGSQRSHHVPAIIKGHRHFSYGGASLPENITIKQFYEITPTKRSSVRLNDQLIPKPTDFNIAERVIKVPIPMEHPYQSHMSRFAMFPTFHSPDDPDTGVRAASRQPLNPLIPASAPAVTVLHKCDGGPYRHELLELPITSNKKAMAWPGQHGFLNYTKPMKGRSQMFYPTAQKTVLPNSNLRDWDMTLSEPTANMLRNVEKSHWVTSYQMNYTGSGPANPLSMDDFHDKTIDMITGNMTPYTAKLRERSHPMLVPPKPRDGRKARLRQGRRDIKSTYCSPVQTPAEPLNQGLVFTQTPQYLDTQSPHPGPCQERSSGLSDPSPLQPGQGDESGSSEALPNQQPHVAGPWCETCREENCECQGREPQSNHVTRASLGGVVEKITDTDHSLSLYSRQLPGSTSETEGTKGNTAKVLHYEDVPGSRKHNYTARANPFSLSQAVLGTNKRAIELDTEGSSRQDKDQDWKDREIPRSISIQCIKARMPALASANSGRTGRSPLAHSYSSLLEFQDSFSRTEVHHRLHSSLQGATADLRHHINTGRKHQFYGFNAYYFHDS